MTATTSPTSNALRAALGSLYAIDRELGRGGMATVYLAQDLRHNRLVALKVLHPGIAESLGAERFLREIQTAARLNHPHILPLFDSGAAGGFLYYVMPYVEGESLRQTLDRLGQIPADEAIAYVQEMAAALDYAHRQGIIHRDIKPENVMLHEGIATLMDFGIAKALGTDGALTQVGMFVGTPAYVSPEQAFGEHTIDGRSDQFSLACMLCEMITGQQLFTGSSPQAIIAKRMSAERLDLSSLEGRVEADVIDALKRAMSTEPAERFETMREFASSLVAGGRSTPQFIRALGSSTASSAAKSVAVLPFENLSADAENDYLAQGVAEEIINALSKVQSLRVASRTASFAMKGRNDLQDTGRRLKVSTVLNGSVRRSGNRIRVSAELVNVSDGSQLWAERYDREMEDVFAIQDEISESIVRALRVILADSERKALKARTRDVRAYEYYLRGRQYADFRRKSLQYGLEMFHRAVEIDPTFASAYAGISDCNTILYMAFEANPEFLREAEAASSRAVELEPDIAETHLARGNLYTCYKDYVTSDREFEMAMRLDPKLFEAPYFYGRNLIWQGKPEEALKVLRIALALRPESYDVMSMISLAYSSMGKEAESLAASQRALKLMEERLELNPDDVRAWMLICSMYPRFGQQAKAENAIQRLLALDDDSMTHYNVACAYAVMDEKDKALDSLEKAVELGYHHREWMSHDTDLDSLRDTERYQRILAQLD